MLFLIVNPDLKVINLVVIEFKLFPDLKKTFLLLGCRMLLYVLDFKLGLEFRINMYVQNLRALADLKPKFSLNRKPDASFCCYTIDSKVSCR